MYIVKPTETYTDCFGEEEFKAAGVSPIVTVCGDIAGHVFR